MSPGDILQDRYRIEAVLGQGGMGSVYSAQDTRLPHRWAVKELADHFDTPEERLLAQETFRSESDILSSLNHPNLPRIVDSFDQDGRHYLVMDYIEGQTLSQRLEQGPMTVAEAIDLGLQLAGVLEYLHTRPKPVIFRDLKPANVMLTREGQVKLIDFGIARIFRAEASKDTRALGTPGYAAPEQYGRMQSDARTDIYALGAVLHHALSGRDPSDQPFHFEPLQGVPELLGRYVLRAVSLKPEDRFQAVADLRGALEAVKTAPETSRLLPPSAKTAELVAPAGAAFQPGAVKLTNLQSRQRARTEVLIRGDVKGTLRSDARWLKIRPTKVKGVNPVVELEIDTGRLPDGQTSSTEIRISPHPEIAPLRVEVHVAARALPMWVYPTALFLLLGSLLPAVGWLATAGIWLLEMGAPHSRKGALRLMLSLALFATLLWSAVLATGYGLLQIDWNLLLRRLFWSG